MRQRKGREATGAFLVEGIRHVGEAVEAVAEIQTVFFAPDLLHSPFAQSLVEKLSSRGVPCLATTAEVFYSLAGKENPQGILAVVRQRWDRLDDLKPENFSWGVAVISPQDPGNIGTILRTIDAVGASGLLLLDGGVDPFHPSAVRASLGALFWHPLVSAPFADFAVWANGNGYHIFGTSARAGRDFRQVDLSRRPAILLMGSEREGLTPEQADTCQDLIRLPMQGRVTSLNLAVATGVMLYAMMA